MGGNNPSEIYRICLPGPFFQVGLPASLLPLLTGNHGKILP